jgi:methyl-accepting chemotaxis protein
MHAFTQHWGLKRWLLTCLGSLGAVLTALALVLGLTYKTASDSRMGVAVVGKAHIEMQVVMRALTEFLMSEGATFSAFNLAKESTQRFEVAVAELSALHKDSEIGTAVQTKLLPAWAKQKEATQTLLAIRGLSPSDSASLAAYARAVGYFDDVVREVVALEQAETQVAAQAEHRMLVIGSAGGALALLALLLIGAQIYRVVFARLGGEPALACELASRVARYDLTVEFPSSGMVREGTVMHALAQIRDSLVQVVAQVRGNADQVAGATAQIAQGNEDLSSRSETQAQLLRQTTEFTSQLGETVAQNASHAQSANQLAKEAAQVAQQGGQVVGQVVETMKGINESSRQIANIIGVIDGIAFQTNILALNAAVEAARAGDQGRGFAVVASEVRGLAKRSADAAKEIKALIQASVSRVDEGSKLADRAGTAMQDMLTSIRRVTDIMQDISEASEGQSSSVRQLGQTMAEIEHTTQQHVALVAKSSEAALGLKEQAQQQVEAVAVFRLREAALERS